jgi:hypothetical protein
MVSVPTGSFFIVGQELPGRGTKATWLKHSRMYLSSYSTHYNFLSDSSPVIETRVVACSRNYMIWIPKRVVFQDLTALLPIPVIVTYRYTYLSAIIFSD